MPKLFNTTSFIDFPVMFDEQGESLISFHTFVPFILILSNSNTVTSG